MEKDFTGRSGVCPNNEQAYRAAKCPVVGGAAQTYRGGAPTNARWWPDQLNLKILHQHSDLSDPMDKEFNYAKNSRALT